MVYSQKNALTEGAKYFLTLCLFSDEPYYIEKLMKLHKLRRTLKESLHMRHLFKNKIVDMDPFRSVRLIWVLNSSRGLDTLRRLSFFKKTINEVTELR